MAEATILSGVADKVTEEMGHEVHLADMFDIMGGTSTGGLVAVMCGRVRVRADTLLETYSELSEKLFKSDIKLLRSIFCGSKYSGKLADRLFEEVVLKHDDPELKGMLHNPTPGACKVFVTAVNSADLTGAPIILRSYDDQRHTIVEAARATTAAPTYFPSKTLSTGEVAVDGALRVNNPTELVIKEAKRMYGKKVHFGLLLSVGTGESGPLKMKACKGVVSALSMVKTMGKIMTDTEGVHARVQSYFRETDSGVYIRINVPGIGKYRLDDYRAIPDIVRATKEYMKTPEMVEIQAQIVKIVVRRLRAKQSQSLA